MARVAKDENLHYLFYRDLVTAALELEPSRTVEAIEHQVNTFEMPGTGIAGFRGHAMAIAQAGIYDLAIHHEKILVPCIIRHWKVDQLTGLDDTAEQARDRLFHQMERIGRVGVKLRDKREARVPHPLNVCGGWIRSRTIPSSSSPSPPTSNAGCANTTRTASCIWVKYAKKSTGIASINWDQAVDVALCYGWIDGQAKSLGRNAHAPALHSPRKAQQVVEAQPGTRRTPHEEGRMQPAGIAEVERAKADGRWDAAYDSPKNMTVPDDLAKALAKSAKARKFFESLNSTNRYAILYRLQDAKKPETRAKRLEKFVEMLKNGEKLYP